MTQNLNMQYSAVHKYITRIGKTYTDEIWLSLANPTEYPSICSSLLTECNLSFLHCYATGVVNEICISTENETYNAYHKITKPVPTQQPALNGGKHVTL